MGNCKLHRRTRIQHNRTFGLQPKDIGRAHRNWRWNTVEWGGALPIHFHVANEVLGTRWHPICQKADELVTAACLKRIVETAFIANRR